LIDDALRRQLAFSFTEWTLHHEGFFKHDVTPSQRIHFQFNCRVVSPFAAVTLRRGTGELGHERVC
jgi:hypothetical protein